MRICIYGAGAIGGFLAAHLAGQEAELTLIARGPHLQAMRKHGLTLLMEGQSRTVQVHCTDDPRQAGPQDCVILTLKAHSVPGLVEEMRPLLGDNTFIVTAQNGIPWWYFYRLEGPWENRRLQSVDPGGRIWKGLGPQRALGCVVYPSCEIAQPGVIRHLHGNRFMLGEPDGTLSERAKALSRILSAAGLKAPLRRKIRDDIWLKLWGNLSFNPVSVLTLATLEQMARHEGVREVIRRMMLEAQQVAYRLGVDFLVDIETRIGWAADVGDHKTSMLQDLEAGKPLEIDALVGSVCEMGRLVDVPTPTIDAVLALVRLRIGDFAPRRQDAKEEGGRRQEAGDRKRKAGGEERGGETAESAERNAERRREDSGLFTGN